MPKVLAVVSVLGKDQKGVVAQVATFLAERGANIEDIEQRVVSGLFVMDMLVDLADLTCDLSDLITGLIDRGKSIDMDVRVHLHGQRRPKRVALLVSREAHCLAKLLDDHKAGLIQGEIVAVLGNHPDLEPMAAAAKLPFAWKSHNDLEQHFAWLGKELDRLGVDLVVLARYMRILPAAIVERFRFRVINIHPSLLPHFPGAAPYRQAFESGVRVSGCTAHFVTEQLDEGPVILQDVFHINVGHDTLDDVKEKGLSLEAGVLSKAVQLYLNEELVVVDGKVIFKPGISRFFHPQPAAELRMSLPQSKGFYRAEAKYAGLLRRVGLVDAMSVFEHPKIEVWRSITERENCVLDADGTRLHIKRNKPRHTGVETEADAIRLLMNANVPTVPLVAAGRINDGRGFLITEDLAGYEDADIAVRNRRPFETVLDATAELAGRLHAAGLHHRDLYLCHFYIAAKRNDASGSLPREYTAEGTAPARLMDAGRVKPLPDWFRRRWLVKDIAQMVYSLRQLDISAAVIDQWLAAYSAAGGATADAAFKKSIDRKAAAIGRHDRALRRARSQAECEHRPMKGGR